jgi:hypothetical protein
MVLDGSSGLHPASLRFGASNTLVRYKNATPGRDTMIQRIVLGEVGPDQ